MKKTIGSLVDEVQHIALGQANTAPVERGCIHFPTFGSPMSKMSVRARIAFVLATLIIVVYFSVQVLTVLKFIPSTYAVSVFGLSCVLLFIPPFLVLIADIVEKQRLEKQAFAQIEQLASQLQKTLAKERESQSLLQQASREVQQESSILESTGRQLADRASDQAASLEEISSSTLELNAQASQNYELAAKATKGSDQMSRQVQVSSEQMQRFSTTMEELRSSIESVTRMTSLIGEIAAQTRMLAINASIEAARAGVHGTGFAVVAQEVRELAVQTSELAEEISRVVSTSEEKVSSGRRLLGDTRGSLKEIFRTTESVVEMMQMICQATEQQLQGIRQVNQSLETLNQLTIENARYADVNAKSSSQLSQQADDLLEATRQLRMWEGDSKLGKV